MEALNSSLQLLNNISEIANYTDNTTLSSLESVEKDTELLNKFYEIKRIIFLIFLPILIIFGTIGNVLTFIIMRRGSLKDVSTCFYMSILALADTGVLIGGLSLNVVSYLIHLKVNAFAWTDCKFTYFFWYFFHQYSSTLLAMMSIEKCIVVYFPLKTKNICTVKTAKWACLISGIAFAAFNSQHFFITEARLTDANTLLCFNTGVSPKYMSIYYKVDSALYSFAPFAIMGLTNIAIIYKFIKAKMAMKSGTESTNQALSKTAMRGTAILITVSLTFIILTGPISIHYALTSTIDGAIIIFYYIFANLSHGINGLMYCIVGSKFRQELIEFICCGRRSSGRKGKSVTEAGSTQLTAVSTVSTNQGKY